jgi:hypothetical protein
MEEKQPEQDQDVPREKPQSTDQPATDTATDWDEWMERHGGRPRPVPDVANAEGKFTK